MCHVLREQKNVVFQKALCDVLAERHYTYLKKTPYNVKEVITNSWKFFWIDTVFFQCHCDVRKMDLGTFYRSNDMKFPEYPSAFKIVFQRVTKGIEITLHRMFSESTSIPLGTHLLRIFFEIANSFNPGSYTDMLSQTNEATVLFRLNDFYSFDDSCDTIFVKCSIWKYEQISFKVEASAIKEQSLLAHIQDAHPETRATYGDMAFLMDRDQMSGIFTHGESEDFLNRKLLLLKRTFLFSGELARRIRCLRNDMPFDNATPVALILGHIYNGIIHHIENRQCLQLLKMSCMYGLPYLQEECTMFLLQNLAEYDFLVDVLLEASKLEHWMLLDAAVSLFVRDNESVVACDRWKELMTYNPEQVRIIDTLRRRKAAHL